MAKEIEINLEEENNVSMEVKDTGNVEIGMESDFGGTTDYNKLKNKPSINGVTLEGNKTLEELGIINYDDTEIKENITEIEKENTYQNKRLEYLEKNQIQGEVNGEDTLTVTDGAFAYANILKETEIEGEKKKAYIVGLPQGLSRQEQREGYNQFNSEIATQNIKGVEISYDTLTGYIKLNGTVKTDVEGEKYNSTIFNLKNSGKISIKGNTNYTLSISKISGSYSTKSSLEASSLIQLWDNSSNTWLYPYQLFLYKLATLSSVNITKSQTTDVTYNQIQLTLRDGDVFDNLIIGIQFNEGELKPFEQYGATPSIEIPSEIENVKAWNLIDVEQIAQQTQNVITTFDKKNGWLTIENSNSNMAYVNILVPVEHIIIGKTYSLKVEFKSEEGCNVYLQKSAEDYSNFTQGIDDIIKNTAIDTYMKVLITPIANQTVTVRLSLAEEQEKIENKPYAPYGAVSIGLGNKNLNDEVYELGSFTNDTGENGNQSDRFRIKNYIDIEKFQSVTIKSNVKSMINAVGRYGLFDKNKIQIENAQITSTNYTINTKNAKYLRFWFLNNPSENFDMNTAKIIVSSKSSDYITHQEQNYNLHIKDLELNGIGDIRDSFVVEVDNSYSYKKVKKLYKKEIFEPEQVFTGNEAWILHNNSNGSQIDVNRFVLNIPVQNLGTSQINIISNKLKATSAYLSWIGNYECISQSSTEIILLINKELAPDLETFKQLLADEKISYICRKDEELIDLTETYPKLVQDIENIINNMFTYEETTHINTSIGYLELTYTKSNKLIIKNYDDRISALEQAILSIGGQNV